MSIYFVLLPLACAASQGYFPLPPDLNSELWFPMDIVTEGRLLGREFNSSSVGSPVTVPGVFGYALQLNRLVTVDQRVNLGNHRGTCFGDLDKCPEGVTWSLWIQIGPRRSSTVYLISGGGQTQYSHGTALYFKNGALMFSFRTKSKLWVVKAPKEAISFDTWHHVVCLWSLDAGAKMYIDGEHVFTNTRASSFSILPSTADEIWLGASNRKVDSSSLHGNCLLDDLRVWYRLLTPDEVKSIWSYGAVNLAWNRLSVSNRGIIHTFAEDGDINSCDQLLTDGPWLKSTLSEVTWQAVPPIVGQKSIVVRLVGPQVLDDVSVHVSTRVNSSAPCCLLPRTCTQTSTSLVGTYHAAEYTCTCGDGECTRVLLNVASLRRKCRIMGVSCSPITICGVSASNGTL